jgi:hypothetical protein
VRDSGFNIERMEASILKSRRAEVRTAYLARSGESTPKSQESHLLSFEQKRDEAKRACFLFKWSSNGEELLLVTSGERNGEPLTVFAACSLIL